MEKEPNNEVKDSSEQKADSDPFNRLMFGRTRNHKEFRSQSDYLQSDTDFITIFEQFDEIVNSINKIKPALKELSPLLDFFNQKK